MLPKCGGRAVCCMRGGGRCMLHAGRVASLVLHVAQSVSPRLLTSSPLRPASAPVGSQPRPLRRQRTCPATPCRRRPACMPGRRRRRRRRPGRCCRTRRRVKCQGTERRRRRRCQCRRRCLGSPPHRAKSGHRRLLGCGPAAKADKQHTTQNATRDTTPCSFCGSWGTAGLAGHASAATDKRP
jgi:hypothetical protein